MGGVNPRLAGALIALLARSSSPCPAWGQDDRSERAEVGRQGLPRLPRRRSHRGVRPHAPTRSAKTLDTLPPEADVETPDLRPALEAAIEQVKEDDCEPEPTPTPSPTPVPDADARAGRHAGADRRRRTTGPTTRSARIPPLPGDDGGGNGGGRAAGRATTSRRSTRRSRRSRPPPSPAPVAPAEPSGPTPPPPVYINADDTAARSRCSCSPGWLALVALLALLYAALSRLGWGERRLARRPPRRARGARSGPAARGATSPTGSASGGNSRSTRDRSCIPSGRRRTLDNPHTRPAALPARTGGQT